VKPCSGVIEAGRPAEDELAGGIRQARARAPQPLLKADLDPVPAGALKTWRASCSAIWAAIGLKQRRYASSNSVCAVDRVTCRVSPMSEGLRLKSRATSPPPRVASSRRRSSAAARLYCQPGYKNGVLPGTQLTAEALHCAPSSLAKEGRKPWKSVSKAAPELAPPSGPRLPPAPDRPPGRTATRR
jgi:hypothetical protein